MGCIRGSEVSRMQPEYDQMIIILLYIFCFCNMIEKYIIVMWSYLHRIPAAFAFLMNVIYTLSQAFFENPGIILANKSRSMHD